MMKRISVALARCCSARPSGHLRCCISLRSVLSSHRSALTFASVLFLLLLWSSLAFCGAIHDAAKACDLKKIQALLKVNPELINAKDSEGNTPLRCAMRYAIKDEIVLLLDNGADVNAKDNGGKTPLHWAVSHKDAAELFIAHGADVNAKDNNGRTPLHLAAWNGYRDVVELLLANKADVRAKDNDGKTPLDTALRQREDLHSANVINPLLGYEKPAPSLQYLDNTIAVLRAYGATTKGEVVRRWLVVILSAALCVGMLWFVVRKWKHRRSSTKSPAVA